MANSDKPDTLSLFNDYAKTTITLASAVLAIIATFITTLLEHDSNRWVIAALAAALVALILAIIFAAALAGAVISATRPPIPHRELTDDERKKTWNKLAARANAAFFLLAFGIIVIGITFIVAQTSSAGAENDALSKALAASMPLNRQFCKTKSGSPYLQSATFDASANEWLLVLACVRSPRETLLLVTTKHGNVVSASSR